MDGQHRCGQCRGTPTSELAVVGILPWYRVRRVEREESVRIDFVEIANFRKLLSTRVGLSPEKTVFVGANNSGKTTAITALRYFLADRERPRFCFNDFTLAHWPAINAMGDSWEAAHVANEEPPAPEWDNLVTCPQKLYHLLC